MKKCPYCAEDIQDEAIVCRWCGRDLVENVEEIARARTEKAMSEIVDAEEVKEQGENMRLILHDTPENQKKDEPVYPLNPRNKKKKVGTQETDVPASPLNPRPRTHEKEEKGKTPAFLIAMPIGLFIATLASIGTAANRATLLEKYGYSAFSPIFTDMVCHFVTNAVIWTLIAAFLIFIFRKIF